MSEQSPLGSCERSPTENSHAHELNFELLKMRINEIICVSAKLCKSYKFKE